MTTSKTHTAECKCQAIELATREDVGLLRAAHALGISPSVLSTAGEFKLSKLVSPLFPVRVERS